MLTAQITDINTSKIMMVDDDPITMEVVQTFLEEAGYRQFELFNDPGLAISKLDTTDADILLLDLVMPEISGFDVLKEVRKNENLRHLPVIILTGASDHESKLKALDLGATDFLSKPVDPSELVLRVRNTLSAKAYQDQLAFYDPVTKLPNRKLFIERFDRALKRAKRYQYDLALISISIDKFNQLNSNLGFSGADELLQQVAKSINKMIRDVDILGQINDEDDATALFRLEGAIMTLLLDRIQEVGNAAQIARRLVSGLREPLSVDGNEVFLTVSIGVSSYPEEADDMDLMIELAANARTHAQDEGGDCFRFSSKSIKSKYEKRFAMENHLRGAVSNEEMILYYQPKVSLLTGKIVGCEALIRWDSSVLGFVSPVDFIPLAEETGLILEIGEWVLQRSFGQLKSWHQDGNQDLTMNVNISIKQFIEPNFIKTVENAINSANIAPHFFTLEITESLLMDKVEETIAKLQLLKDMGFNLSIDDFGTGYSSFSYLCRMPVDELKIDRAFIMHLPEEISSAAVVDSIVFLSEKLGLKTVAEGVETTEQLAFLQNTTCTTYQGYLFSRPLPSDEFYKLLHSS